MARFHINSATGQAGECDAVTVKCPFGRSLGQRREAKAAE